VSFEELFFGPGNRISWQAIQAGTLSADAAARLAPFLDGLRSGDDIIVLPRVTPDQRSQWYFLCASERHSRLARDLARAFLGPSYSDLDHHPRSLDPNDAIDAAVLSKYDGNGFRITVPERGLVDEARGRLGQLISLRREQPIRDPHRLRPIGRILRDFEYALLAKDAVTAGALIAEIRSVGYLSANNLAFLTVLRLASVEDWRGVLALPELQSLLVLERPRRVTEALIRAIYSLHVQEFEEQTRIPEAIDRFRSRILASYGGLYRSRSLLSGFAVDASFALAAAAGDPPQSSIIREIQETYAEGTRERLYFDAINAFVAPPPVRPAPPSLKGARAAYAEGNVDIAFEIAQQLAPTFERASLLLNCASEMATLASARAALAAVEALSPVDRQRVDDNAVLRHVRSSLLEAGTTQLELPSPASWPEWFARLSGAQAWKGAVAFAETAAREWSVEDFLRDPVELHRVADLLLEDRPAWARTALLDSVPHFLWFLAQREANARLRPVYDSLFVLLAADADVSLPQLQALLNVVDAQLTLGVNATQYSELLGELNSAFQKAGTPATTELALEAIELLVNAACPAPDRRSEFVGAVAALFQRWSRRTARAQWMLLQELGAELDLPLVVPQEVRVDASAEDEWEELNGKQICLYSLQEAAVRRAADVIGRLSPESVIRTFHDLTGGSSALRTAARTADIFVVATAAATHAATMFIDANRPTKAITLRPNGKGSSSLLDALQRHLRLSMDQ
jgi:hypothetical protein